MQHIVEDIIENVSQSVICSWVLLIYRLDTMIKPSLLGTWPKWGSNLLLVHGGRPNVLLIALFHSVWRPRTASVSSCQFWLPYQAEQYVCSNFARVEFEANENWQLSLFTELMYVRFLFLISSWLVIEEQSIFPKYFTAYTLSVKA